MSGAAGRDHGDGLLRVLAVEAEAGGDAPNARQVQEVEGGVAQQGQNGRPLPEVDEAGVLAERDVLLAVEPVLDRPMAAPQRQQGGGIGPVLGAGW